MSGILSYHENRHFNQSHIQKSRHSRKYENSKYLTETILKIQNIDSKTTVFRKFSKKRNLPGKCPNVILKHAFFTQIS